MKKMLKIIGIIVLVIIALLIVGVVILLKSPAVPNDYYKKVKTGGDIEAKYLAMGSYEVAEEKEISVMENFKKYIIYYPKEMESSDKTYPVIIFSNGTGVKSSKYPALFKHLASWGFVVVGTEEQNSWNGFSSEMCLRLMIKLNETKELPAWDSNPFYNHIDIDNIGLSGHSQGGVGVINAVTENKNGKLVKTIFAASPSNMELAHNLEWDYDPELINIPTLLVSGTGKMDETGVVSGQQLTDIYNKIPNTTTKIMMRKIDYDHGDMLYAADGYMTAWFMYWLQNDTEAGKAFFGENAEINSNSLYQDVQVHQ